MATLLGKLKDKSPSVRSGTSQPIWAGPGGEGLQGGITQGLIGRYLCCRERFRLLVMEGLKPENTFNHSLEYGNLWHVCEEALAGKQDWGPKLLAYAQQLARRYPFQQQQVNHWYNVCKIQFPVYVDWWAKNPDVRNRKPLMQEQVFDVSYFLPSGRAVRLRGKWDGVDLIGSDGIFLQENKTKGDVSPVQIQRQLTYDLQTMMYIIAYQTIDENPPPTWKGYGPGGAYKMVGVRYNVVRRPLSGGKGTIRQHKPTKSSPGGETDQQFYSRLAGIIREEPQEYFMRWTVTISPFDLLKFKEQTLNPVLENLCDDYEWWKYVADQYQAMPTLTTFDYEHRGKLFPYHRSRHFREPFGVYNPIKEGGSTDLDNYLASGSEIGLQRTDNLFPELTSVS